MGIYKEKAIKIAERGFRESDKKLCALCVGDYYLRNVIRKNGNYGKCDFCLNKTRKVLPMEEFMYCVMRAVETNYMDSYGNVPFTKEDGYLDKSMDAYDFVFDELAAYLYEDDSEAENIELLKEIYRMIDDKDRSSAYTYYPRKSEELFDKWDEFCNLLKNWKEYSAEQIVSLCVRKDALDELKQMKTIMMEVLKTAQKLSSYSYIQSYHKIYRCVNYLPKGYVLPGTNYIPANQIGTPPSYRIKEDNRFSEAGDMMFYGAENTKIAAAEIEYEVGDKPLTIGVFHTNKRIKILNLAEISIWSKKSFFDIENLEQRESWLFLRKYTEIISQEIKTAKKMAYKPTEVFTKFIQRTTDLHGLCYWSSKSKKDRYDKKGSSDVCYVLFAENRDCIDVAEKPHKINTKRLQMIMESYEQVDGVV